jgi:hypothetical protein
MVGIAVWFGYLQFRSAPIADLLANPRHYEGKTVAIDGRVVQSQSLLIVKYFILEDKTGRITVVTDRALPQVGQSEHVRGKIREAFAIGSEHMIVLMEEPVAR